MRTVQFYGAGFPYHPINELSGSLFVLEGTDGVGRSTQVALLRGWLEEEGYAVSDTGLNRSPLTQPGLDAAKSGHTLSRLTMSLFYATDFADRLENQIIPALKAGFTVLSDRYFYSTIARDVVRGAEPNWVRSVYGFALKPTHAFYLRADLPHLLARTVHGAGFDYWESGMDIRCADNLYDSFVAYQSNMIDQFDRIAEEYHLTVIDANQPIDDVFQALGKAIRDLIDQESA